MKMLNILITGWVIEPAIVAFTITRLRSTPLRSQSVEEYTNKLSGRVLIDIKVLLIKHVESSLEQVAHTSLR